MINQISTPAPSLEIHAHDRVGCRVEPGARDPPRPPVGQGVITLLLSTTFTRKEEAAYHAQGVIGRHHDGVGGGGEGSDV